MCLPCSTLQSCVVLSIGDYAEEPVFGIGLLSALSVPKCPLNSYNLRKLQNNMACEALLLPTPGNISLFPQWLHISSAEDYVQAFTGGEQEGPKSSHKGGLEQSWSCFSGGIHLKAALISCFKCPLYSSVLWTWYAQGVHEVYLKQ